MERPDPASIPELPGSYQFRDAEGRIIYVGKARSLRARISSYFVGLDQQSPKTRAMLRQAASLTWITVSSDAEALLLEDSLIKQHRPRYNIRLRDDKTYPLIALTTDEAWPRVQLVRGKRRKRVRYFGPYASAGAARETLELLSRAFPLRSCSPSKLARHTKDGRPCLYYHLGRCVGPCIGAVSKEAYHAMVDEVGEILQGRGTRLVRTLESSMRAAAAREEYELAARYRDQLRALERVLERQEVVLGERASMDVFGVASDELEVAVAALRVRHGRVLGAGGLVAEVVEDLDQAALLARLVELYYTEEALDFPRVVVLPWAIADPEGLAKVLGELAGHAVQVRVGQRGSGRALVELARGNAEQELARHRLRRASDASHRGAALVALQRELGLREAPLRIECYDMSHLQGSSYVGSMVVMEDGLPKPREYRHFQVSVPKNDDFAAMAEVLERRFRRLLAEEAAPPSKGQRFRYRPQLVLLDGGLGQLGVGVEVLGRLGLDIELASLAKSFEEVYRPGSSEPVRLPRGSEALYLLQRVRDEAHRFAITYHRRRRVLSAEQSILDRVPGVGPRRRAALLERFGSIFELAEAGEEAIVASGILPRPVAHRVAEALAEAYGPRESSAMGPGATLG